MSIELEVQNASGSESAPGEDDFRQWITPVLAEKGKLGLTIRIVDAKEMQALNSRYRGKDMPTNVLSFSSDIPVALSAELEYPPLGDIAICASVVEREAQEQNKPVLHHWAHLTVHGVLHLLGHDHQSDEEADNMEILERNLLASLGIPDPYIN